MADITVIGGGLAGMVAAIAAAEQGAKVYLYEAHQSLGGRARSTPPPFVANDGPHALYDNGALWPWLADRDLIARPARVPLGALAGFWFRWQGRLRHRPPCCGCWPSGTATCRGAGAFTAGARPPLAERPAPRAPAR